ncbi:endonuclease/exonuclease/phosphatase family protein [Aliihoeflea sp. 40Bstr573]|uniref:endonuclease/exonuclease/phosphatase family protein n=1 Tax=Aliihoeflea sp. 40Bstr573 TaxID=2696467 RepID=UPI002096297E|nr:endonuclease/exonuclease/phosphatase family protein [Aliihoeflea sp. 40Bstr573]MCO6387104.1 EEP domain-containing protein [Aliihoeflea sp. 40Bstr573]
MKCVSYNIQYGIGLDKKYDIARIVDAVRGADLIALQEVSRNNPSNQGRDMPAEIRALMPDLFSVYGPSFEIDMGSHVKDGKAVDLRFQFGNMILSRMPILVSRNLLLPRRRSIAKMNFQRSALEVLVETTLGPIRFYSIHLDHRSPDERLMQVRHLRERVLAYPHEGGGLTGVAEMGFPEPPRPESAVLLGDFNMLPGSPEYLEVTGMVDHEFGLPLVADKFVDVAAHVGTETDTCVNADDPDDRFRHKRIDYAFVTANLADRVKSCHVDTSAVGSDHRPVWVNLCQNP